MRWLPALLPLLLVAAVVAEAQESSPLERLISIAEQIEQALKVLAGIAVGAGAAMGVINWIFGRGPELLGRAAIAAIVFGVVLWIASQFIGGG